VQNVVLDGKDQVAHEVAQRAVAGRLDAYTDEVRRFLDAAYEVMRRSDTIDPSVRDIVRTAGLSNAAFYRHFASKDALLLAVIEDGRRRLLDTLQRRLAKAPSGEAQVRAWIEAVLDQARSAKAAENTRPFALNGARLRERFPVESGESVERLLEPLRAALRETGSTQPERDARAIHELAFGTMNRLLLERSGPTRADIDHLVAFALRAITRS
jgi:AcrR family transcriptional regulator